jgi:transcriptional regulator with XRE-family HTH domain
LIEIYQAEEFKRAWANDVPYQVAMNILQLRRHREMTQKQVADEAQTSQSAIARIESDGGNIKLATLQRIIESLKGRLHLSITPEEFAIPPVRPWWESMAQTSETSLPTLAVAVRKAMASKTLSATEAGWVDAANTSPHFLGGVINGTKKT